MPSHKENVAAAIVAAKADLDEALTELEHLPAFDPGVVGFAAHALSNYLSVAGGVADTASAWRRTSKSRSCSSRPPACRVPVRICTTGVRRVRSVGTRWPWPVVVA